MSKMDDNQALAKAEAFFERARGAANASNFDYAVEMYIEGLRSCPDALEVGHIKLHELALLRQSKGGKKPSMMEKVKQLQGKTALDRMLNAEHLFRLEQPKMAGGGQIRLGRDTYLIDDGRHMPSHQADLIVPLLLSQGIGG